MRSARAAAWVLFPNWSSQSNFVPRKATRRIFGRVSLSSSTRLPSISGPAVLVTPVTFPPGRARLATSDKPIRNRVVDEDHDDRDHARQFLRTLRHAIPVGHNDIHLETDQTLQDLLKPFELSLGGPGLKHQVPPLDVPEHPQFIQERSHQGVDWVRPHHFGNRRGGEYESDAVHLTRPLGCGGERRGEETASQATNECP